MSFLVALAKSLAIRLSIINAISSLVLSEVYGVQTARDAATLEATIEKSLSATLSIQRWRKQRTGDRGGWRYLNQLPDFDSDLSLTGWALMSLRSAKNAGFDVAKEPIDEAVTYVKSCYHPQFGTFNYASSNKNLRTRAMSGAGILALAHAGIDEPKYMQRVGDWILQHNFQDYNRNPILNNLHSSDRYHYSLFNCTQGMYQLGGRHWDEFFPPTAKTLLANQQPTGSWPAENHKFDRQFGSVYTTSLVVLSLGAPNQLLPIFQR